MTESTEPPNPEPARQPPPRRPQGRLGGILALAVILVLLGTGILMFVSQRKHGSQEDFGDRGLNVGEVEPDRQETPPAAPEAEEYPSSEPPPKAPGMGSIQMVSGGKGMEVFSNPRENAIQNLARAVRANEPRYESLAMRYTKKYPVVRRYGRDWMSYPDLRRFNNEYFQDHDPIKFARNVAASPNFAKLLMKYAHKTEGLAFIQDALRAAPADLMGSIQNYLGQDGNATEMLNKVAGNMGLPPGLIPGLATGQVNPQQAVSSMLKSNPQLQGLLERQNIDPNQLNSGFKSSNNIPKLSER